jgi:hypothetical protein
MEMEIGFVEDQYLMRYFVKIFGVELRRRNLFCVSSAKVNKE